MTNIVTNADGSIEILLPPKIYEWGVYVVHPLIAAISAVVLVGLLVLIFARKRRKSSN
jgi:hypothetical protein